ncbi:hypothetical protein BRPE64_ACDS15090 [Caballeronia insecticola]|uniref:Uncharacterized protein n=1 Tax=Caballeronia insecticola TaxID=758793 RepID=R4WGZ4_9BURK|nr:hypothetical protein BRPE64_ACDS15090 [Caballeronia insecticola]
MFAFAYGVDESAAAVASVRPGAWLDVVQTPGGHRADIA